MIGLAIIALILVVRRCSQPVTREDTEVHEIEDRLSEQIGALDQQIKELKAQLKELDTELGANKEKEREIEKKVYPKATDFDGVHYYHLPVGTTELPNL